MGWNAWLRQRKIWLPTITFIPFLYLLGWLFVQPLQFLFKNQTNDFFALLGTLFSVALFVLCLPSWIKVRWKTKKTWKVLGLLGFHKRHLIASFLKGLFISFCLLTIVAFALFVGSWGYWVGGLSSTNFLNSLLLAFGVGLIEELIFRGWLLGELDLLIGTRFATFSQAIVFSLAHIRFDDSFWVQVQSGSNLGLFLGLFLFGFVLGIRRRMDGGCLWGCIGIHGGLVGGWFALQSGLIHISSNTPTWIIGPGDPSNPLGGMLAILVLSIILYRQLVALDMDL